MPDPTAPLSDWVRFVAGKIGFEPPTDVDPGAWLSLHLDQAKQCMTRPDYDDLIGALIEHRVTFVRTPAYDSIIGGPCLFEPGKFAPSPLDPRPAYLKPRGPEPVRSPKVASFDSARYSHDRDPLLLDLSSKMTEAIRDAQASFAVTLAQHPLPPGWDWKYTSAQDPDRPGTFTMTATPYIATEEAFEQAVRVWGVDEAQERRNR